LNQLRNALAHGFEDEVACVEKFLPHNLPNWAKGNARKIDPLGWVITVAAMLFFELGIVSHLGIMYPSDTVTGNVTTPRSQAVLGETRDIAEPAT
jgi:hypothetical protein